MTISKKVKIVENILSANDQIANDNTTLLQQHGITAINIMASPGAGKTSLILETIKILSPDFRTAVIEGDTAPVTIDADQVAKHGIPVVQINTGGSCHLDALMLSRGLNQLPLDKIDLIIVENVGNLVCPAAFKLGTQLNIVVASTPEGDDKPYKYPAIYRGIDALILNKVDLKPYLTFNIDYFQRGLRALNPKVKFIEVSCKTGEGIEKWANWLKDQVISNKKKH